MSRDFTLYMSKAHVLTPPALGPSGQIALQGPDRLEDEDIPDEVHAVIGTRRVAYQIHLEGVLSPEDGRTADAWMRNAIQNTKGVLIDLQTEVFETATKGGQLKQTANPTRTRLGGMSFHFADGEAFYSDGFEGMLSVFAEVLPSALPARYGLYEPLQNTVLGKDMTPVVAAFQSDTDVILKGKAPFGHLLHSIPCKKTFERFHPKHSIRREFLLANVSLELRPKVFTDPVLWPKLVTAFERLCVDLDVIYAEISQHPAHRDAWFWYGLPGGTPRTMCIGPTYRAVWPEAETTGRPIGGHHLILDTDRFGATPPPVPENLLAPSNRDKNPGGKPDYATVFPFEFTYDYDTYHW
jgi:hypothetical protein